MINKVQTLPKLDPLTAEATKIQNLFTAYPDDSGLYMHDKTGAVIFILNGDAIISGKAESEEIKKFLVFTKPKSVFSSEENLSFLFGGFEAVNVLILSHPVSGGANTFTYDFLSHEAYELLEIEEFSLPPYEYFATDYCHRKNHGLIKVFGKKDTCIAVTLEGEKSRLLSGIVSKQKGLGGALLLAATAGNKPILTVCRDELLPFYQKFGFKFLYKAGYWRK